MGYECGSGDEEKEIGTVYWVEGGESPVDQQGHRVRVRSEEEIWGQVVRERGLLRRRG